jgi:ELWxxDGT repeat protein
VLIDGVAYFRGSDDAHGQELWRTDGTAAGTRLVADIIPGPVGSMPDELVVLNGTLFFAAYGPDFSGQELWRSDGTAAGTVLVKDIAPGSASSNPVSLTVVGRTLFFNANDGVHGYELWKSDGTAVGTTLVKEFRPGPLGGVPVELTNVDGTLFFVAKDDEHGDGLWKSDGTEAGTVFLADLSSSWNAQGPAYLTDVNGTLFFLAAEGTGRFELWKSDGTTAGTVLVKDIDPVGGSNPGSLTNVNGTLFFGASDGVHGREPWISDGTTAGTVMLKDINPGPGSSFASCFTDMEGTTFFGASSGSGFELWRTDGTSAGTVKVKYVAQYGLGLFPVPFTRVQGTLFFGASNPDTGDELWKSDGTAAGTVRVRRLRDAVIGWLAAGPPGLLFAATLSQSPSSNLGLWGLALPTIANDDGRAIVARGDAVSYRIEVANPGDRAMAATVTDTMPLALEDVQWTCYPVRGAVCTPSGTGSIGDNVTLPGQSRVVYAATGTVAAAAVGAISNTANVTIASGFYSQSATDTDVVETPTGLFVVDACRLVDTRAAGGPLRAPSLLAREPRVVPAHGRCGIPATARAVAVNVTVTSPTAAGHVRLFPTGQVLPAIATVSYSAGQTRGGNAIVSLDAGGRFTIYAGQPPGTTVDVVVDVTGYFE